MYCDFFGLCCLPFEDRADTQFALTTSALKEVMAALDHPGAPGRDGKGLALVEGEAGAGKTLLIRLMLTRMGVSDRVVVVNVPGGRETDVVRETCKGFGVTLPVSYSYARGLARLRRHLIRTVKAEHRSTLIVDQAENLTPQNLGHLAALADFRVGAGRLLTIILVAQPLPENLLRSPEFARLEEHFFTRHKLPPLTPEETEEYIHHRLQVAGAAESALFEPDAVEVIHREAGGNPRRINQICHAAMLAACDAGDQSIRRKVALEVTPGSTMMERSADVHAVTGRPPGSHPASASWPARAGAGDGWPTDGDVTAPPWVTGEPAPTGTGTTSSPVLLRQSRTEGPAGLGLMQEQQDEDYDVLAAPAGAKHTAMAGSIETGDAWVDRLERLLARAERVASTHEASIAQYTAVEKHLTSLTASAERLAERLAGSARQASTVLDGLEKRTEGLLEEGERRAGAIETKAARTMEVARRAGEQVQRVENACEQADKVEARLTVFAEQLADKADIVQERLSLLMTGLASGEDVYDKLQATLEKTSTFTGQAQTQIDAQQAKLNEAVSEAEGLQARFTDTALEDYRKKLESQFGETERERLHAMGTARAALQSTLDRAGTVTADAEAKISSLNDQVRAAVREGERHLSGLSDLALKNHRDKLREQSETLKRIREDAIVGYRKKLRVEFEAHQRSQREVIEAARTDCDALQKQTVTIVTETDQAINELHEKLRRQLGEAQRSAREFTDVALELAQQKLEAHEGSQRKVVEATISAHRAKLRELLDDSASQIKTIDATVVAARKKADQTLVDSERSQAERLEKLRKEREEAGPSIEALETRISEVRSLATPLVDQIDGAATQAGELTRTVHVLHASVMKLGQRADSVRSDLAPVVERGEELVSEVQSLSGRIEAQQHQVANSLTQIGNACASVAAARDEIQQQEEVARRLASGTSAGEQVVGQLGELLESAQKLQVGVQHSIADAAKNIGQLDSHNAAAVAVLRDLSGAAVAGRKVIEQAEKSAEAATQASQAANEVSRAAKEQIDRWTSKQTVAEHINEQLDKATAEAAPLRDAVERLVGEAAEKIVQLETHHLAADRVFEELSNAASAGRQVIEQADKSAEAAARASHVADEASKAAKEQIDRWTSKQTVAEHIHQQLDKATADAAPLRDAVERLVGEATEKIGQLDSHNAAAGHVLRELADANVAAHHATQETSDAAVAAQLATQTATEQSERLTTAQDAGVSIVHQLEEVLASAGQLQQIAQQTVTDAAGRIGQLDAHSVTAGRLIRELSDANATASGTLEKADDATQSAHDAVETAEGRIEKLLQEVSSVTTTTEARAGQLADCTARAERCLVAVNSSTQSANAVTQELAGCIEQAEDKVRSVADHCGEADKLVERLGSIRGELRSATETEASVRQAIEQAQTTYAELSSMTDSARQYNAELGVLTGKAQSMTRTQQELTEKAEALSERLSDRLSAGKASLETGENLLDEFVTQAQTVSNRLDDLHRAAAQVQQTVSEATEKPSRIIAGAQAQAAQLERVCTAVRKVFAGLSKATLEARSHTEGFRSTSQEAVGRLARLTAQTDRASKTLQEWIEESLRVQSRLERTLQNCPSIHETHPVDGLDRLSEAVTPWPSEQPHPIPASEEPARPAGRAQVISQLIEDAKRTAAARAK